MISPHFSRFLKLPLGFKNPLFLDFLMTFEKTETPFEEAMKDPLTVDNWWRERYLKFSGTEKTLIGLAFLDYVIGTRDMGRMKSKLNSRVPSLPRNYQAFYQAVRRLEAASMTEEDFEVLSQNGFNHRGLISNLQENGTRSEVLARILENMPVGSFLNGKQQREYGLG
jgi:hypothetical protein